MTLPDATVCIPWRPSPSRMKPYEKVRSYWAENFPDWPVITADSDTPIFSLSQARNNAARQAETDILVFCDADTIPPTEGVKIAVTDPVGVTWPHKTWVLIPAEYADKPFSEFPDAPILVEHSEGLGGVMVCTADEFWRLGGQPSEFLGWGHEDRCFHMVVQTLSTLRRIGGTAYSIEHNQNLRISDSPGWHRNSQQNAELARPYENAVGKPWLMKELLRIRAEESAEEGPKDWRTRTGARETDPVKRELFWDRKPKVFPTPASWQERWTGDNDPLAGRYKP